MSNTGKNMIYIDSNVFIYAVTSKSDEVVSLSKNIMSKITEGEMQAFTSVLTWDEFFWVTKKIIGLELAKIESSKFLGMPNLRFISADEVIIRSAQRLIENYNLTPRDAIHAASAISHGIKQIITDDPDFDKLKEIKRVPIEK